MASDEEKVHIIDRLVDNLPDVEAYDPCPCGCGMKWKFVLKLPDKEVQEHLNRFLELCERRMKEGV